MGIVLPVKSFSCSSEMILGNSFFSKVAEFSNNLLNFIKKFLIPGAGVTLKIAAAGRKGQRTHGQTAKAGIFLVRDHFNTAGGTDIGTGAAANADI